MDSHCLFDLNKNWYAIISIQGVTSCSVEETQGCLSSCCIPDLISWAIFFCQHVNPLNIYVIGYFLTRIFHPNIASNGEICVNTLKKDWNPSLGLRHVLTVSSIGTVLGSASSTFIFTSYWVLLIFRAWWYQVVRCLLIEPFPESALNEQAGKMLLENYEEYARHARWAIPYLTNQIPW